MSREIFLVLESDGLDADANASFLNQASALGLRPILLNTGQKRYRSLASFESLKLPSMNESAVWEVIERLGRDRIRGVWTLRHKLVRLASVIAVGIGRPAARLGPIEICCDKFRTRQVLNAAGVNNVRFALARSGEEAAAASSHLGSRVVVKPRSLGGSVGVRLCCDREETRRYFDFLAERLPRVREEGALIETAVEGRQFSVQIFDGRSLGVTRQDVAPPPAFVTVGLDFPWSEDARIHGQIVEHAERAIMAVGYDRGPASIDLRYDSQGPRIIEINPRLAGDRIPENIWLATGIDVLEATIRFACGMPYDLGAKRNRASATRWLLRPDFPVREVVGRNRASRLPGVIHVVLNVSSYGREGPPCDYRDRLAYVIAEAESAELAGRIAKLALRQLRIKRMTATQRWLIQFGRRAFGLLARVRVVVLRSLERSLL